MTKDIEKRISIIHNIFQNLNENIDVLDFLVIDLHPEKFNYSNNKFLLWLWKNTMSEQLISFYHLVHTKEKHSLQKLINLLINAREKIDYKTLNNLIENLNSEYVEKKFEIVRSKYIAHKDIEPEKIETDMDSVKKLTKSLIEVYTLLYKELNLTQPTFNSDVKLSIRKIFTHINEYENLLTYVKFEKLKGRKNLSFDDLIKMTTL